jgi:DNA-binding MarR family transcriptional regulator
VIALDPVIHAPVRLRLMGIAKNLPEVEYAALRDRLEISDSVLSKHLAALTDVGYVTLRKGKLAGRSRTWVSVTDLGSRALDDHVAALRRLAAGED